MGVASYRGEVDACGGFGSSAISQQGTSCCLLNTVESRHSLNCMAPDPVSTRRAIRFPELDVLVRPDHPAQRRE